MLEDEVVVSMIVSSAADARMFTYHAAQKTKVSSRFFYNQNKVNEEGERDVAIDIHPSPFSIDVATAVTTTTVEGLLGQNIPQKPW